MKTHQAPCRTLHFEDFLSFFGRLSMVALASVFAGGTHAQEAGLLQRLDKLERGFTELQQVLSVSILASTRPCADLPGEWANVQEFAGKFVLGADENYPIDSEGGLPKVQLSIMEMPSHRHGIPMVTAPHDYLDDGVGTNAPYFDYSRRSDVKTKIGNSRADQGVYASGGGQAHENMPPYRVAYFCKLSIK